MTNLYKSYKHLTHHSWDIVLKRISARCTNEQTHGQMHKWTTQKPNATHWQKQKLYLYNLFCVFYLLWIFRERWRETYIILFWTIELPYLLKHNKTQLHQCALHFKETDFQTVWIIKTSLRCKIIHTYSLIGGYNCCWTASIEGVFPPHSQCSQHTFFIALIKRLLKMDKVMLMDYPLLTNINQPIFQNLSTELG